MDRNPANQWPDYRYEQPESETMTDIIENLPATIDTTDPDMLRKSFQSIIDGVMNLSTFAKELKLVRSDLEAMKNEIEVARAQLTEAYRQRDDARAEATAARHDAQMAREAYDSVNTARQAAEAALAQRDAFVANQTAELADWQHQAQVARRELNETGVLLTIAREERDRFREGEGHERDQREIAQLRQMELEEANTGLATALESARVELDIRERALNDCADRVAGLKHENADLTLRLDAATQQTHVLTDRTTAHENDIARLTQEAANYRERLRGLRNMIGSDL